MAYWYLNDQNIITNEYLPENINEIYSPPYPATFWYYDENLKRLDLTFLPEELKPYSIYLGGQIKNIYIGDKEVQTVYIGDNKI